MGWRRLWVAGLVVLGIGAAGLTAVGQSVRPEPEFLKNSRALRSAFSEAAAPAAKSTVKVLSEGKQVALGTIVSADGYILTKASELSGKPTVELRGGTGYDAKLIGVAPDDDLAMLKIDAKGLSPVAWGDAKKVEVGQWLASPSASSETPLAVGVVSVGRRKIPAKAGILGVSLADADDAGAKVAQVLPDSGAEKAGVKVDDIITAVDGKAVKSRSELIEAIRTYRPGDKVNLTIKRGATTVKLTATLGSNFTGLSARLDAQNLLLGPVSKRASAFPAVIQHDTVIRPVDCGGPVVTLEGKAVGLNIARAGRTESYALPSDVIEPLIADLKAGKYPPTTAPATAPRPEKSPETRGK